MPALAVIALRRREDLQALVTNLKTATVVTNAIAEAPAVYGLILFLIGGHVSGFYLLLAYSLVLLLASFPRYGQWEAWATGAEPLP